MGFLGKLFIRSLLKDRKTLEEAFAFFQVNGKASTLHRPFLIPNEKSKPDLLG
jgi:hypothetical protein